MFGLQGPVGPAGAPGFPGSPGAKVCIAPGLEIIQTIIVI